MIYSKRITFMGTPSLAVPYLENLHNNKFNVVAVYTQPPRRRDRGMVLMPSPVQQFAEKNNIPFFNPTSLDNISEFNKFKELKNDLVIVMGYGLILPKNYIEEPVLGCINIHLSLLPKWRGSSPVEYSLLSGETETGVTIFKLNEKLDKGPILISKKCQINNLITKGQLQDKLNNIGIKLLIETLPDYLLDNLQLKQQDETKSTYASKITSLETRIDFFHNAKDIFNKIRAFSPKPGAWCVLNKERIKILSCSIKNEKGEASRILSKSLLIGCKDYSIKPLIIQREGKKIMEINDFIKGFAFDVGDMVNLNG